MKKMKEKGISLAPLSKNLDFTNLNFRYNF